MTEPTHFVEFAIPNRAIGQGKAIGMIGATAMEIDKRLRDWEIVEVERNLMINGWSGYAVGWPR